MKFSLVILVIMLSFVLGCTYLSGPSEQEYANCKKLSDSPQCGKWGCGASQQEECIQKLAVTYSKMQLCNETYSQTSCIADMAISQNNKDLCSKASSQDYCKKQYAIEKTDFSVCQSIENESVKSMCYKETVYENSGWMENTDGQVVKNKTKAVELCNLISEQAMREECIAYWSEIDLLKHNKVDRDSEDL